MMPPRKTTTSLPARSASEAGCGPSFRTKIEWCTIAFGGAKSSVAARSSDQLIPCSTSISRDSSAAAQLGPAAEPELDLQARDLGDRAGEVDVEAGWRPVVVGELVRRVVARHADDDPARLAAGLGRGRAHARRGRRRAPRRRARDTAGPIPRS